MRVEICWLWRKTPCEFIRKHEPVDWRRNLVCRSKRCAETGKAGLVDRIAGVQPVLADYAHRPVNLGKRVFVYETRIRVTDGVVACEVDRARIEDGPFDQPAPRELFNVRELRRSN